MDRGRDRGRRRCSGQPSAPELRPGTCAECARPGGSISHRDLGTRRVTHRRDVELQLTHLVAAGRERPSDRQHRRSTAWPSPGLGSGTCRRGTRVCLRPGRRASRCLRASLWTKVTALSTTRADAHAVMSGDEVVGRRSTERRTPSTSRTGRGGVALRSSQRAWSAARGQGHGGTIEPSMPTTMLPGTVRGPGSTGPSALPDGDSDGQTSRCCLPRGVPCLIRPY